MAGRHRKGGGGVSTFLTGAWLKAGGRERGRGGRHNYGNTPKRAQGPTRTAFGHTRQYAYTPAQAFRLTGFGR